MDKPLKLAFIDAIMRYEVRNYVVAVDNSHFMSGSRWRMAESALAKMVGFITGLNDKGFALHVWNDTQKKAGYVRDKGALHGLFNALPLGGGLALKPLLQATFDEHLHQSDAAWKPTSVLVLCTGTPRDVEDALEFIAAHSARLQSSDWFSLSILQVGAPVPFVTDFAIRTNTASAVHVVDGHAVGAGEGGDRTITLERFVDSYLQLWEETENEPVVDVQMMHYEHGKYLDEVAQPKKHSEKQPYQSPYPHGQYQGHHYQGGKYADIQYPDSQYPDSQYPDSQYPDSQYPDSQYPDSQYPDSQYPDSQYPDSQYPDSQYPDSQYPDSQYPDSQYPDSQYPDSQYPDGQYSDSPEYARYASYNNYYASANSQSGQPGAASSWSTGYGS